MGTFQVSQIISFDAQKLYTSVNTELAIKEICSLVYKNPKKYFKIDPDEKNNFGQKTKIPPIRVFQNFLYHILLNFNSFSTVAGYYKQTSGLSMGSKVSPLLANFYLHLMEERIIENEIKNGNIISYCRFVDDVFCIINKKDQNRIFQKMNNFDKNYLKFTVEEMSNNSLTFLDTEIYLDENKIPQIKKFRKETASDVILNFNSITPKKYKISTLKGDIFRCNHTCTTDKNLNEALVDLTELYVRNEYPKRLVESIINEIKDRKFENNGNKNKYQELKSKSPMQFYTMCISFTSMRCEKVASKILKLIKKYTPSYNLNIAWKCEKLQRHFSHRLKLPVPEYQKIGTTYAFECVCKNSYIGETKRQLGNRIKEHNQKSKKTAISDHIYGNNLKNIKPCLEYQNEINQKFGDQPNPNQKITFIKERFKIIKNNLTNTRDRKSFEAVAITIHKPKLNAQVFHRKVSII
jgi:hypothetical protein